MVKPGALRVDRIRWNENKEWKRIAGYKDGLRADSKVEGGGAEVVIRLQLPTFLSAQWRHTILLQRLGSRLRMLQSTVTTGISIIFTCNETL
jgi:hypothetical protein